MRKLPRGPALLTIALATALFAQTAAATDLLEVWRAAAQNDKSYAVDSAAHAAAQPRRDQAAALWKPRVGLTASMGMGTRMGLGAGRGAVRWGSDFTPGWGQMTPDERKDHQAHMSTMKTYDECKTYRDQHHEQMAARAKERDGKALAQPRRDASGGLKK